jgi:hypothetical protein
MLTLKKLERFVKVRNKSQFSNNLQFGLDADGCGFDVADLGSPRKYSWGYVWVPTFSDDAGPLHLWEVNGRLKIHDPAAPTDVTEIGF